MKDSEIKKIWDTLEKDIQDIIIDRTIKALGVGFVIGLLIGILLT